jgi:RNA-directed DNA polymerase
VNELKASGKPFDISKWEVWEAWGRVKADKGAPGVDGRSIEVFEKDLKNNLYKIWNRMSSGSYFPPPVRAVEIPKSHGGGTRILGVPTVADRIAQTVVARRLEARAEPAFHPDSCGYRPGRSALDSEVQARAVLAAIAERMEQVGLRLHPDKTRIVYCKDGKRRGSYEHTSFTFLGFTFQQRRMRDKNGKQFSSMSPAISKEALKRLGAEVRSWRLHLRTGHTFAELARAINPIVRGWMQYYGAFYRSAMYQLLSRINAYLVRWIRKKYKRLQGRKKAMQCWRGITERYPRMFAHWAWTPSVPRVW